MTDYLYKVCEYEYDVVVRSWGIFYAYDGWQARELAAAYWKNNEIVTSNHFRAEITTEEEINESKKLMEDYTERNITILNI